MRPAGRVLMPAAGVLVPAGAPIGLLAAPPPGHLAAPPLGLLASLPVALQMVLSLGAVLGLVLLAGFAARRYWPAGRRGELGVLRLRATLVLDARRRLHLVETPHGAALVLTGGGSDCLTALPKDRPA